MWVGLNLSLPGSEQYLSRGSVYELGRVISQVIICHLHVVLLQNSHQDRLDDLVSKGETHALPGAHPESPTRVTVLSREDFTEAIRSEDVPVGTPNWSITVEGEGVDEDGGLGGDVVSVDDLGVGRQLREGIKQDRVQTTGFEVAVVEEGIGFADVCVGPVLAVGAEGFV